MLDLPCQLIAHQLVSALALVGLASGWSPNGRFQPRSVDAVALWEMSVVESTHRKGTVASTAPPVLIVDATGPRDRVVSDSYRLRHSRSPSGRLSPSSRGLGVTWEYVASVVLAFACAPGASSSACLPVSFSDSRAGCHRPAVRLSLGQQLSTRWPKAYSLFHCSERAWAPDRAGALAPASAQAWLWAVGWVWGWWSPRA